MTFEQKLQPYLNSIDFKPMIDFIRNEYLLTIIFIT